MNFLIKNGQKLTAQRKLNLQAKNVKKEEVRIKYTITLKINDH